LKIETTLVY